MAKFYITTAIDYVNSRPHLGTAYEKICADVIARYQRLRGATTHFLMGNDEHSVNVYRRARELGLDPLAYCDQMEAEFREVWRRLNISFDDFIRTTEERHKTGVRALIARVRAAGDIYEGIYEGWYCPSCESFKQEKDLAEGLCPAHGLKPEWIREKNFFFRLSRYRERLLKLFEEQPSFLEPEIRRNEILRLLEGGLEDISISRAGQPWGIPLEFAPGATVYVWFDALINYISAVGYGWDPERFARWWPADLHVVGKDITRFHTVIWPAMLMSAGVTLPRQVFGHGWVLFKGERMSKTLGTVVDPLEAADRFGPDPLRLYLVREVPFGADGEFSWERFEERYNADLANNLGNLVNRIAVMAGRYCGGQLQPSAAAADALARVAARTTSTYTAAMDRHALHEGAAAAFALIDGINEFLTRSEPWVLARRPEAADQVNAVLFAAAEALRIAAVLLGPIMPRSAGEIRRRVGDPVGDAPLERAAAWTGEGVRPIAAADPLWPRLG